MSESANVVVGDLSTMAPEVQAALTPAIADSFLESAVMADKRELEINRADYADDLTTQYLIEQGYMKVIAENGVVVTFYITDVGVLRGAQIIQKKLPKL